MIDNHVIEKGLALPQPRNWFGIGRIESLSANLAKYLTRFGEDNVSTAAGNVLEAYYTWHAERGLVDNRIRDLVASTVNLSNRSHFGCDSIATISMSRSKIATTVTIPFQAFLESRKSTRQFSPEPVDPKLIEKAVQMAIHTPSVCNRQSWRVHAFSDPIQRKTILECQTGNRGFTHEIGAVLIPTCDLSSFVKIEERNQPWIEGGLFSMSLILALHSLELGTCCLHWCVRPDADARLRKIAQIPDSEVVIMLIAVGNLREKYMVARSPRKSLEETLVCDW